MSIADGSVYNGMPATDLGEHGWERPWSGPNGGQCVETKLLADGRIAVRQSTDPAGPALIYTPEEIGAFVQGVKQGLADHLTAGSGGQRTTSNAREGKATGHLRPRATRHTAVHLLEGTG
ncbi:regulatory protein [Streptomyces albus]|uniref:Regulatory protein n=1 Tax=Streptomyces albus (strain ATCC 21838 / DSM 41398 / FERM P-419 / JCM 4703 / NBRC 107858) TaxID=1081613 RepID=A0A0B5EQ33_STRA4|nr:regulatory protein [Streptomyces albus]AOU75696.1 regulatory protein [Streptomyces albus]AYN31498.1 DUF397 domain-containing protein [Streptomyces albus]